MRKSHEKRAYLGLPKIFQFEIFYLGVEVFNLLEFCTASAKRSNCEIVGFLSGVNDFRSFFCKKISKIKISFFVKLISYVLEDQGESKF